MSLKNHQRKHRKHTFLNYGSQAHNYGLRVSRNWRLIKKHALEMRSDLKGNYIQNLQFRVSTGGNFRAEKGRQGDRASRAEDPNCSRIGRGGRTERLDIETARPVTSVTLE